MACRYNSGPDVPVFQLETLERSLAERYKAAVHWDRPKHPAFNTYEARLQSFDCGWPHGRPDARLLSATGFFHTGTDLKEQLLFKWCYYITHLYLSLILLLQVLVIKPDAFTAVVH
jgi:hypothetical protein